MTDICNKYHKDHIKAEVVAHATHTTSKAIDTAALSVFFQLTFIKNTANTIANVNRHQRVAEVSK